MVGTWRRILLDGEFCHFHELQVKDMFNNLASSEAAGLKGPLPNRVADKPVDVLGEGEVTLSTKAGAAAASGSRPNIPGWLGEKSGSELVAQDVWVLPAE